MRASDEEQLYRDELAERRRDRDRHREPSRWRRPALDLRAQRAFKARQLDLVNACAATAIECPNCLAPVFAPADSNGERVDCAGCDARLVTVQVDGEVTAVLESGGAR